MRLRPEFVEHIAKVTAEHLVASKTAQTKGMDHLTSLIHAVIMEDLEAEDALNEEVQDMVEAALSKLPSFEREEIEYEKMFAMVKKQLIKDKGLIL